MLHTKRLRISELSYEHCEFIFALVNQPSFKQFIGDKGVRTIEDAREYLHGGPISSYASNGFGLYLVCRRHDAAPIGICGLVKRAELEYPDLGFAFLEEHWANGYAYESSLAVIEYAQQELGLTNIVAVADGDNESSIRLLGKLGFEFEKMIQLSDDKEAICRYALDI